MDKWKEGTFLGIVKLAMHSSVEKKKKKSTDRLLLNGNGHGRIEICRFLLNQNNFNSCMANFRVFFHFHCAGKTEIEIGLVLEKVCNTEALPP